MAWASWMYVNCLPLLSLLSGPLCRPSSSATWIARGLCWAAAGCRPCCCRRSWPDASPPGWPCSPCTAPRAPRRSSPSVRPSPPAAQRRPGSPAAAAARPARSGRASRAGFTRPAAARGCAATSPQESRGPSPPSCRGKGRACPPARPGWAWRSRQVPRGRAAGLGSCAPGAAAEPAPRGTGAQQAGCAWGWGTGCQELRKMSKVRQPFENREAKPRFPGKRALTCARWAASGWGAKRCSQQAVTPQAARKP